jgi:SAM-dependent methyltransferase
LDESERPKRGFPELLPRVSCGLPRRLRHISPRSCGRVSVTIGQSSLRASHRAAEMSAWWQEFFDDAYIETYLRAGYFDASAEEVEVILSELNLRPGDRVLDVPCGWGRHAGLLHSAGMDVTAVDLSASQLRVARERHPGPTYVQADMRLVPEGPFDAVINLFSSIGYFAQEADDLAALRAWRNVLRPGGQLVMETNHRDRLVFLNSDSAKPRQSADPALVPRVDWEAGVVYSRVRRDDGTESESTIRLYCATELVALCRSAGFAEVRAFGSLRRDPLAPQNRLVIYASA